MSEFMTLLRRRLEAFDEKTSHMYMSGDCQYLAIALNRVFGYQIEILWDEDPSEGYTSMWPEDQMSLIHVYGVLPGRSSKIVDIHGVRAKSMMLMDFDVNSPHYQRVSEAELKKVWKAQDGFIAERYVKEAIELVHSQPVFFGFKAEK